MHGEDEVARLGESYNEMASSIQSQIRQLEEFGALQRRFTSDVSHELRTPLTTVRMAADVLHASRDELLPALRRSSELLVDRAGPVRGAARRPAGDQPAGRGRGRARGRAGRRARGRRAGRRGGARHRRRDRDRRSSWTCPTGVYAEVDPRRVERIVRNLVANAIDHGEGRPVRVDARLRRARGRRAGPRPRRRAAPGRGGAGVQPVLAGRGVARAAQRRQRARAVDRHRGRPAARRLAAGVGRARAGRGVPADAAAHGRRTLSSRARCRSGPEEPTRAPPAELGVGAAPTAAAGPRRSRSPARADAPVPTARDGR